MPLITFSPNTTIKSADVNSNFSGLANGSLMSSPSIANAALTTAFSASGVFDNGNSGSTKTIDWSKGDRQKVTMSAACTFSYSNAVAGQILTLQIDENSTGGYAVTMPANTKWANGNAGVFTTAANSLNLVSVYFDGTNYRTTLGAGFA